MYNVLNWYWVIAASTTEVFSSASLSYVPITDASYITWHADNDPSPLNTALNLAQVVAAPVIADILAHGITVTSTATSGLDGTYAIDSASQQNITALSTGIAAGRPLPGSGTTFNYSDASGVRHAFTAANFLNFAVAAENYIYHLSEAVADRFGGLSTALPSSSITIA